MHSDIDEVFYVISGKGTITINKEEISVKEKDIIFSPAGETHGFQNTSSDNWVVLQMKIDISSKESINTRLKKEVLFNVYTN
jgi:mannose-6-phosphate isomerase-like protein (cupin superfamily)